MFSNKIKIELEKKDDIFHLEPLGDIHVGHAGFDADLYKKRIKAISKDKNRYTIFMGDQLDAISVYDKRFNPDMSLEHDIDNQRKEWQKLSQPLIDAHLAAKKNKKSDIKYVKYVNSVRSEKTGQWRFNERMIGLQGGESLDAALKRIDKEKKLLNIELPDPDQAQVEKEKVESSSQVESATTEEAVENVAMAEDESTEESVEKEDTDSSETAEDSGQRIEEEPGETDSEEN